MLLWRFLRYQNIMWDKIKHTIALLLSKSYIQFSIVNLKSRISYRIKDTKDHLTLIKQQAMMPF